MYFENNISEISSNFPRVEKIVHNLKKAFMKLENVHEFQKKSSFNKLLMGLIHTFMDSKKCCLLFKNCSSV